MNEVTCPYCPGQTFRGDQNLATHNAWKHSRTVVSGGAREVRFKRTRKAPQNPDQPRLFDVPQRMR